LNKFREAFCRGKQWIEMMVDNVEEMVEKMGKIDNVIALEEKEKEERKEGDGIIAATLRKNNSNHHDRRTTSEDSNRFRSV